MCFMADCIFGLKGFSEMDSSINKRCCNLGLGNLSLNVTKRISTKALNEGDQFAFQKTCDDR